MKEELRSAELALQAYERANERIVHALWDDETERELVLEHGAERFADVVVRRIEQWRRPVVALRSELHDVEDDKVALARRLDEAEAAARHVLELNGELRARVEALLDAFGKEASQ
jgi:hypothetical protein